VDNPSRQVNDGVRALQTRYGTVILALIAMTHALKLTAGASQTKPTLRWAFALNGRILMQTEPRQVL
jgi:hypothetical protein